MLQKLFEIRTFFVLTIVLVLGTLNAFAASKDDYWAKWRSRQRSEFATLRPVAVPPGEGNPIDRFLEAAWTKNHLKTGPLVDDPTFARRVYLDVIGLLPTAEQLAQFEHESSPDKRQKLVARLLSDNQGYAEHWMTFWNDLLRNDEQTNIDGLRKPVTSWLYDSLVTNKPVDLLVAELLNPGKTDLEVYVEGLNWLVTDKPIDLLLAQVLNPYKPGRDGYLKGVNWRGRVNASQTPPIQAAQNVSQVFLASSLKCASCHNSFINAWKLKDAYGLASFFSAQNLEMHLCDKPTGKMMSPQFLFPGLGEIGPNADLETRHQAVAQMVTRAKNPRFAGTMVNRLWKRLLGRGLFEPVDDFDSKPVNSSLLEWLANDFMGHDYDARHTIQLIMLSRVYQLPVARYTPPKKTKEEVPCLGPAERRLTSEQFLDAVAEVTGFWPQVPVMNVKVPNPKIRAWRYRKPDTLATALGRPNREQVCTERNQESTVLQSLELVNGNVLADRLREGAKTLLASDLGREANSAKVAQTLYIRVLGRPASALELKLAQAMVVRPNDNAGGRQERWEDFLWTLFMSPEFQFVQ